MPQPTRDLLRRHAAIRHRRIPRALSRRAKPPRYKQPDNQTEFLQRRDALSTEFQARRTPQFLRLESRIAITEIYFREQTRPVVLNKSHRPIESRQLKSKSRSKYAYIRTVRVLLPYGPGVQSLTRSFARSSIVLRVSRLSQSLSIRLAQTRAA